MVDAMKTLAVRGAPAIGGVAPPPWRFGLGRPPVAPRARARFPHTAPRSSDGRGDRLRAPDRGEPALGGRARAGPRARRSTGRGSAAVADALFGEA
ncbi:MAG: hypothetical protein ACLR3C_07860 [Eggerthella lenta]